MNTYIKFHTSPGRARQILAWHLTVGRRAVPIFSSSALVQLADFIKRLTNNAYCQVSARAGNIDIII